MTIGYSGETLTFTFFINVAGPFDYLYIASAFGGSDCHWNSWHDAFHEEEEEEASRQDRAKVSSR